MLSLLSAINGNYSEWSDWSLCSRSCSGGIKTRKRECINPSPQYGGRDCKEVGSSTEKVHCNPQPCPGGNSVPCLITVDNLSVNAEMIATQTRSL